MNLTLLRFFFGYFFCQSEQKRARTAPRLTHPKYTLSHAYKGVVTNFKFFTFFLSCHISLIQIQRYRRNTSMRLTSKFDNKE